MRFRSLDASGDWVFGLGRQAYAQGNAAIALSIATRLREFLNDNFWAPQNGIDWFNLLGSKNQAALIFSIQSVLLSTPGVNSVTSLTANLDADRKLNLKYSVTTVYGASLTNSVVFPVTPFDGVSKFVGDIYFNGLVTSVNVDVSVHIRDTKKAIFFLYDESNAFSPVLGAVAPLTAGSVQITIAPAPPAGYFRLVGIA